MTDMSWLAWPGSVVVLGGAALTMFRTNIAKLIDRAESAKVPGIELSAPVKPQISSDPETLALPVPTPPPMALGTSTSTELPAASPVIAQVEEAICRELEQAPKGAEYQRALLVRALAIARVLLTHEGNYRVIFSTQIMLLKSLNDRSVQTVEQARFWYDVFHTRLPDVPITFEEWLRFLQNAGYVRVGDIGGGPSLSIAIDPLGRDFLLWLVHAGVSEARPG